MKSDRALVAHLMRRAGFGATPAELDALTREKTYEEIVDDLVNPERFPELDQSYIDRYYGGELVAVHVGKWIYRMVNTQRPLEEKMSLFLHHIFPVAWGKSEHGPSLYNEIAMFRRVGLTDMKTILLELSKDPAMIFWLDNNENHKDEINENYGRELLELFSMGVGNYTEDDIKAASRAFTGWTFRQPLSLYPVGHHNAVFEFHPDDHDYGEKTFLGHTGDFDGVDIIDIIVDQPATARFISRHLYNFFVEDEVQVPSWNTEPPKDEAAIQQTCRRVHGDRRPDAPGPQGTVQLRLLQERDRVQEGQESYRTRGWRPEADGRIQQPGARNPAVRHHHAERLSCRRPHGHHGTALDEPADGRGLAHGA